MTRELAKLDLTQLGDSAIGPVLVHADLMRARSFVGPIQSRTMMIQKHVEVLLDACGDRPLWTPCFNYDFCGARTTDLRTAPSQVGPLGQAFLKDQRFWRSTDPVFSICGSGNPIEYLDRSRILAFGAASGLGQLFERNGSILFYGTTIRSATILHLAESRAGGPIYRYDKVFTGELVDSAGEKLAVEFVYHVRPKGMSLDYDWERLERDLYDAGVICFHTHRNEKVVGLCDAKMLVDYWVSRIKDDPKYLLDHCSRKKVDDLKLAPGERVKLEQFE